MSSDCKSKFRPKIFIFNKITVSLSSPPPPLSLALPPPPPPHPLPPPSLWDRLSMWQQPPCDWMVPLQTVPSPRFVQACAQAAPRVDGPRGGGVDLRPPPGAHGGQPPARPGWPCDPGFAPLHAMAVDDRCHLLHHHRPQRLPFPAAALAWVPRLSPPQVSTKIFAASSEYGRFSPSQVSVEVFHHLRWVWKSP